MTPRFRYALVGGAALILVACWRPTRQTVVSMRPEASVQELMQDMVDPSAGGVWNAVETDVSQDGIEVRQPRDAVQWQEVRRAAISLLESSNLLMIDGRRVGRIDFPAEADGALVSIHIQARNAAERSTFNAFAAALRETTATALAAIDARDATKLVAAGGAIDQVCEGCHLKFWYPNQVIPPLPRVSRATVEVSRSCPIGSQ